jgi:hypothetical protein
VNYATGACDRDDDRVMMSPWWLVSLLFVPVLVGLALLMDWLEVVFTHRLVADEVAVAWRSSMSIDELEQAVSRSIDKVMLIPR